MPEAETPNASEVVRRGKEIYETTLRDTLEAGNVGKYLYIETTTGEWEMFPTKDALTQRLHEMPPGPTRYLMRIGFRRFRQARRRRSPASPLCLQERQMMEGFVRFRETEGEIALDAVVRLTVRGFNGQEIQIEAVVDTGFSGALSLRAGDVALLELPESGVIESYLADGTVRLSKSFTAIIEWDFGVERLTSIDGVDPEPLLGMGLLRGHNLSVDAEDGGAVRITKLAGL